MMFRISSRKILIKNGSRQHKRYLKILKVNYIKNNRGSAKCNCSVNVGNHDYQCTLKKGHECPHIASVGENYICVVWNIAT